MRKKTMLWALLVLIISFAVVFYKFNQIPADLTRDEVESTRLALSLNNKPYTAYSPLATGHATMYFYFILTSFKIFGLTSFALRLPSAIFGVMTPVVFFLIMNNIFKKKKIHFLPSIQQLHSASTALYVPLSFLLSILLVTQRWYFNFARFSFEVTFLLFLELISIYFLIRYIEKPGPMNVMLSGVFAGLAYNSYLAGRGFFILPLIFIGWPMVMGILHRDSGQARMTSALKHLSYFIVPLIIITTPLNLYLIQNQDIRIQQQSYFNNTELTLMQKIEFLYKSTFSTALMFTTRGDVNGIHNYPNKPTLNFIMNVLFFSGLIVSLKKYRDKYNILFYILLGLSLIPTVLTYPWENPNILRTYTAIPAVIFFSGQFILFIQDKLKKSSAKNYLGIMLVLLILTSALIEFRSYYVFHAKVIEESFEIKDQLRGLEKEYVDMLP